MECGFAELYILLSQFPEGRSVVMTPDTVPFPAEPATKLSRENQ